MAGAESQWVSCRHLPLRSCPLPTCCSLPGPSQVSRLLRRHRPGSLPSERYQVEDCVLSASVRVLSGSGALLKRGAFPGGQAVKALCYLAGDILPGESQGRGSLVGFHLCGRTELDTTEVTVLTHSSCFLDQLFCLGN